MKESMHVVCAACTFSTQLGGPKFFFPFHFTPAMFRGTQHEVGSLVSLMANVVVGKNLDNTSTRSVQPNTMA